MAKNPSIVSADKCSHCGKSYYGIKGCDTKLVEHTELKRRVDFYLCEKVELTMKFKKY